MGSQLQRLIDIGGNVLLFEVDMTDRLLAVLKERRDKQIAFIDEMGTW